MDYNPPYVKCFHGVYDARFCSICIGTATPDRVERFTDELVKDKPWSGHGVEQAESTAPWNAAPVLKTSEEIWAEYASSQKNIRLANRVHDAYVSETMDLQEELESLGLKNEDELDEYSDGQRPMEATLIGGLPSAFGAVDEDGYDLVDRRQGERE